MGKYIRIFIAIIAVLSLVILAKNKAAWAADPAAGTNQSALAQAEQSVSPDRDDGCDKDKDKDKCKDKDDNGGEDDDCDKDNDKKEDKDKCKDKDDDDGDDDDEDDDDGDDDEDDDGTVKPPDDDIKICKRGEYSVGGVATLEVKNLRDRERERDRDRERERDRDRDCFKAHTEDADTVSGIPSSAGTVLSDVVVLQSFGEGSNVKICFAVPPGKQVKIYFSGQDSWRALRTTLRNGIACAQVPRSGSFTLVGK